jgi:hypothetical protein
MKKILLALMMWMALCSTGYADSITITPLDGSPYLVLSGPNTDQPGIDDAIHDEFGYDIVELYKRDVGKDDQGLFENSYNTVYTPAVDPSGATIDWVSGTNYITGPAYLLVKDGNHNPAWYLFDLTKYGWDGKETLVLQGFWPNRGAISHVAIYGDPVPEPATMLLFGTGIVGLVGVYRRKRK